MMIIFSTPRLQRGQDSHGDDETMKPALALLVCCGAIALAFAALGQPAAPQNAGGAPKAAGVDSATERGLAAARDYHPPQGIAFRAADFISENVRLTAQWFYAPKSEGENEGRKLPTVIIANGWGGTAASLRQDAVDLARAGYLVMLFDYRGWGDSDGRVMLTSPQSKPGGPAAGGTFTAQLRELRGYVDPWEQVEDWFNAISYAAADPMVDAGRIGVLGYDLSGGHVIDLAAHEPRVKALVSQVTRADTRPVKPYEPDPARVIADANTQASRLATGGQASARIGAPVGNKVVRWAPVEQANQVTAPALFVLAQKEELFSNTYNGQLACERVTGPRKMVMFPNITHDGVYGAERQRAITAAIDWFDRYLKPPDLKSPDLKSGGPPTRSPINSKEPERGECNPPPLPPAGEEEKTGSGQGHKAQATSGRFN